MDWWVTSPTWGPPPPSKQALKAQGLWGHARVVILVIKPIVLGRRFFDVLVAVASLDIIRELK